VFQSDDEDRAAEKGSVVIPGNFRLSLLYVSHVLPDIMLLYCFSCSHVFETVDEDKAAESSKGCTCHCTAALTCHVAALLVLRCLALQPCV
jgi:hypothetical protein